jgi:hypothetical protein
VRKLVEAGLIESQLVYDGGIPTRVVKIEDSRHAGSAGGKTTALPKKWAAMRNAAERELRAADEADPSAAAGGGAVSVARSPEAKAAQIAGARFGGARATAEARLLKAAGMAAARAWRESRRCKHCGALGYLPCAHRPDGAL